MTKTKEIHEGGCLCGAIRYRATAPPIAKVLCHCRSCRMASGAPSLAWTIFPMAEFAFTAGKPVAFASSKGVERLFCSRCGTSLAYVDADHPDRMDITTATLNDPSRCPPDKEIWVEEKIPWEVVDTSRPRYPRSSRNSQPLP